MKLGNFKFPWTRLHEQGILGMNRRNGDFISVYNPRKYYPRVDNKRLTKELAMAAGIAVPKLYGVVEIEHQVEEIEALLSPYEDFVIKPSNGSGGNGILVIIGRRNERFRKSNGEFITLEQIKHHISNILSGMFSLGAKPDRALIEYRVKFDPFFAAVSYQGVPDIRIIVFRGIPVMAMARLPTAMSDGKANLHQGAVGVGIEIASGSTLRGVWKNQLVDYHPDTENPLSGLTIPNWDKLLTLAASCRELAKLDYIGCDFVLDEHLGPLMLELNARPGLSIQLSNRHGLEPRLEAVERTEIIPDAISERVALAKQICGNY